MCRLRNRRAPSRLVWLLRIVCTPSYPADVRGVLIRPVVGDLQASGDLAGTE